MALFLFLRFHLVFLLIGLLSSENGPLLPVNAAANVEIPGPELNIANPPPPEIILTQLNTPLLLPCTATLKNITVANRFDFEIQWSWHRNGKKLSVGKRSDFQLYDNGSLSLPFIEKASGIYRCIVNATEGIILSTQSVVKYASLKKISAQSNIQLMEGMHLVLNCPVISVPNANITWRFGNDPIETQFHRNRILQLENGTLIIKNITSKEKGKYKCTAENRYATKKDRRFNWNISVQPSSENYYKELLLPPLQDETQYIPSRSDFTLRCLGYTNVIEWFFVPRLNGKYPIKINNNSNEIIVRNANEEIHGGFYNCSTKKDFQVFEIKVTTPPQITESFKSYECTLAAPVSLKCNARGNPPPEITWYRNGIKIENENTVYYTQPILRIHSFDLKDDGFYQCFARNVAGESSISGILKLRRKEYLDTLPRRPENVKCFPVNYTTLNVTFNSTSTLSFMSIHFVTENPYKWNSSLPIKLKSNSFLIISQGLPLLKPFSLYMRGLVQTSTQITFDGNMEHTFDTSLLTDAIKCATQGLIVNGVFFPNGIFIWWHHNFVSAKYFIVQFWNNETTNPVFDSTIIGTTHPINLYYTRSNIERQLYKIPVIQQANTASQLINGRDILRNEQTDDKTLLGAITNVIIPGNVTGILIPNTTRVTVRVLVITEENEDLTQDLSYVQWKTIENTTTHNFLFKVSNVESRTIMLMWNPVESVSCIKACYYNVIKAAIRDDLEKFCQDINVSSSAYFTVRKLKPLTPYRMDFMDCKTMQFFGSTDVQTKSDPPGSIRNHNISNSNGLKLSWDPPLNTNGDIMYYVIWWTINNFTNEANVTDTENSFKFPNVTENDKINVTIRVVGRNGIGPPVFIDLRNIESEILEKDKHFSVDPTLGIILGVLLSLICICVFIYLFIRQRKRFKSRINRSQHDEQNLPAAMTPSIELHEMQTLIPKYPTPFSVVNDCDEQLPQQPPLQPPRTLPNGNGVQHNHDNSTEIQQSDNEELSDIPIALCSSTPLAGRRKDLSEILYDENSPKLNVITPANTDNIQLNKISSSPNFFNSSKAISNKNATQLQNGYIKTLLPPLKHSISTVSSSEPKLLLVNGGCKLPENSKCKINTNSNTSTTDNSQLKLLGTNLDRNKKHKNYRNSCDETINSENNDTATTMINMDDTIQGYRDPVHPTNWNYRRPIIDPNG